MFSDILHNKFPSEYVLLLTTIQSAVTIGGQPYTLGLFDTAGQEDDDRV